VSLPHRRLTSSSATLGGVLQQAEGSDPSPVFSTGEATAGVLCSVLGYPVQEGHGHTRESPVKGLEDDEETGASPI